jgi:hypothetical protein
VDGVLSFRRIKILSITPVMRHSFFDAAVRRLDNDLDLPLTALAALNIDIEHQLEPLHLYALRVRVIDWWRSADVLSSPPRCGDAACVPCPASLLLQCISSSDDQTILAGVNMCASPLTRGLRSRPSQ